MTPPSTTPVAEPRSWPVAAARAVLVAAGALVVLVATLLDRVRVETAAGLRDVELGLPLAWMSQDQSRLDPPLPQDVSVGSPWENPTTVQLLPLAIDIAVVVVALLTIALAVRGLRKRPRTRRSVGAPSSSFSSSSVG